MHRTHHHLLEPCTKYRPCYWIWVPAPRHVRRRWIYIKMKQSHLITPKLIKGGEDWKLNLWILLSSGGYPKKAALSCQSRSRRVLMRFREDPGETRRTLPQPSKAGREKALWLIRGLGVTILNRSKLDIGTNMPCVNSQKLCVVDYRALHMSC